MMPSFVAQSPWMDALGWTLLHFLWQGALVGVVFATLRALIPASHCNARYANGLAALALMLVFPLVTLFTMLRADGGVESVLQVSSSAAAGASAIAQAAPANALSAMDAALQWVVCLWVAGVLLVAYRSWLQWRSLIQIARKWAQSDPSLEAALLALAGRFELMRRIRVLVSDRIDTPILIGWFKPVILLPTAVVLGFPRQQIELILAHELGHLRRYDHVVNLAQALVETLLFYHPVVHWISREIRNEREICCDSLVLHKTSGDPREYARTLAALEELRQPPAQLALAASGGVLLDRVRRILGGQRNAARSSARWPWLLAIAGTAVSLLVAMRVEHREPLQVSGPELLWERPTTMPIVADAQFASAPARLRLLAPAAAAEPPPRPAVAESVPARPVAAATRPKDDATPSPEERVAAREPAKSPAEPADRIAAIVQAPVQPEMHPAPLAVADVSTEIASPMPPPEMPKPSRAGRAVAPVATYTVSPEYPDSSSAKQIERVKLEFAIASDGSVRDIRVVSEQPVAFARAAERALKQWRFEPNSLASTGKKRYAQTFIFASPLGERADAADASCVRRTGSQLCRHGNEPNVDVFTNTKQLAQMPYAGNDGG